MDKQPLNEIRTELLSLHKALLEFEKRQYEGKFGKISSSGILLNLLMENAQFSWLRQISEFIVGLDELLDSKEEVEGKQFEDMISYCQKLLTPNQGGNNFESKYYEAIHNSPDVALAHAKVQSYFKK